VTGPANIRDVGGLPLVGGGVTRSGVLLRGDALYDGDTAPTHVAWPPSTVIDLRSATEHAWSPYPWEDATRVVELQLFDAAALARMPRSGTLLAVYRDLVANAAEGIARLVDLLPDEGATYLHCSAGKDRTGAATAALLLLAGVTEETVIADYQATAANIDGVLERLSALGALGDDWDPQWAATPAEAIAIVIEAVTAPPGGAREWFLQNGATEDAIDRFVSRLRQEAHEEPRAVTSHAPAVSSYARAREN
jgi:hypothetical protein